MSELVERRVDIYTHGHHDSVLRSHSWRTAQNSAAYLLDFLQPGQELLDVVCGPGSITVDLAARVSPGRVIGVDREAGVIAVAEKLGDRSGAENVIFATGDVYDLDYEDDLRRSRLPRMVGRFCGRSECESQHSRTRRWPTAWPASMTSR